MRRGVDRDAGRDESQVAQDDDARKDTAGAADDDAGAAPAPEGMARKTAEGVLCYGGARWPISGRALRLMLWLAAQQQRINTVASERGQLWITWKGNGPDSIDGEVKARLSRE